MPGKLQPTLIKYPNKIFPTPDLLFVHKLLFSQFPRREIQGFFLSLCGPKCNFQKLETGNLWCHTLGSMLWPAAKTLFWSSIS